MINDTFTFEKVFAIFAGTIGLLVLVDLISLGKFLYRRLRRRHSITAVNETTPPPTQSWISRKLSSLKQFRAFKPLKPLYRAQRKVTRFILRWGLLPLNVALIAFAVFLFNDMFVKPLNVNYHKPVMDATWLDSEEAFVIQFDRPFDPGKIDPYIFPEVKGKWIKEDKGINGLNRRLLFQPEESFLPDVDIQIYVAGITNYYQKDPAWDKSIDLLSPKIPSVMSSYPENDGVDFGLEEDIVLNLDQPDGNFVAWDFKINPEVSFQVIRNIEPEAKDKDRQKILIRFDKPLNQNATYTLSISKTPQSYNTNTDEVLIKEEHKDDKPIKFSTIKAASISKIEPSGEGVLVSSDIRVNFDFPMDQEQVLKSLKLEPAVEADYSWVEGKILVINPKAELAKDKTYSLSLPKGLKNKKGGISEQEVKHSFKTVGYVGVTSFSPGNNTTSRSINSNVSVTFNQEVDKSSAQSKFKLSPNVAGKFSWNGNTLTFNPNSALAYQTTYSISVASGVKTIHGLDSKQSFNSKFTTEPQVFSLAIPYSRQPYRYACNLTAAKMALGYRGISRSVEQIHAAIGTDSTPWDPNSRTWGNPHSRFVGSLSGSGSGPAGTGGYGVYWGPIRNYIANQGRDRTEVKSNWNTTALLKEVRNGNPVIIWAHNGYSGSGANISWKTSGGANVYAVKGMHSYVVRGYIGTPENPTHIMFADPGRGLWTVSIGYFNSLWGTFGRTAVVVR